MTSWMYSLVAACAAVFAEVWFKNHPEATWGEPVLWPAIFAAFLVNFGIWGTLRTESLLGLTVLFSLFTAALRIGWTVAHGNPVATPVWVAFALVIVAGLVKVMWR